MAYMECLGLIDGLISLGIAIDLRASTFGLCSLRHLKVV